MSSTPAQIQAFITKWQLSGAAERANAQLFLAELCDILDLERPQPTGPDETLNAYCFEKAIPSGSGTTNFIDLYKRGHFVLECKQGVADAEMAAPLSAAGKAAKKQLKTGHGKHGTKGFDTAMLKAHAQAQRYARALPKEEVPNGRPPFVVVVDVGHSISLYTDWTRMGGEYLPFPDPASYRIPLKGLLAEATRATLRAIWTDPLSLDPGRRSAKVTREIADSLAKLARSLEGNPGSRTGVTHTPEAVAAFLMRSLFTMFAEDVDLLPFGSFTKLLGELKDEPGLFKDMLENLWATMNTGGLSPILRKKLPRFNGGLFAHADAIHLNKDQVQLLLEASTANWKDVEPAIFGTLLERALDPRERHKLGAHYTPRAYVERLVNPTVIEPLRAQWKGVQVAALQLADDGQQKKAIAVVESYLHELGHIRVLDPACGSGNFLYVTLELLKRLEGEVLNTLAELGQTYKLEYNTHTISPANFLGIELNPRAAAIAEQVLWIGFLQWQLRTQGHLHNLPEPIIKDLHNIQCRDAVLEYDARHEQRDAQGNVVTRWDGRTTKTHPVTGEPVPDPEAREPVYTYTNPRPAQWPQADYIVGNPPFIGSKRMRETLGDDYVDGLQAAWPEVPQATDFVMRWWHHSAELVRAGKAKRFGLITTNSLKQAYVRRAVEPHLEAKDPVHFVFAVPDHPWVDSADGAAVRIAMTVCEAGKGTGLLMKVVQEARENGEGNDDLVRKTEVQVGVINADLTIGSDLTSVHELHSNGSLCSVGMKTIGAGFQVDADEARRLGLGKVPDLDQHIRPYINGRDFSQTRRGLYVIDLFGTDAEQVKVRFPEVYQHLLTTVKPERDQNRNTIFRRNWWIIGHPREQFRKAVHGMNGYIVTLETSKHRLFGFLPIDDVPDSSLVTFALDDAYYLGVLSSHIHVTWALATGGTLEDRPRYNKTRCFETFPFPACTPAQQERIRALGEQLDAHRKRQQALHPELTMTGMYNVLERVKEVEGARVQGQEAAPLSAKEKKIYEQGLVGILKQLHDELDAAVAEAYGWSGLRHSGPDPESRLPTDEILSRLVALNAERAAEEANGQVRWLRPAYQNPQGTKPPSGKQATLPIDTVSAASANVSTVSTKAWPSELPAQAAALTEALEELEALCTLEEIAAQFQGKATKKRLEEMERLLHTLAAVGRARSWNGKWAGV